MRLERLLNLLGCGGLNVLFEIVPLPQELFHCDLPASGGLGLVSINHSYSIVNPFRFSFAHLTYDLGRAVYGRSLCLPMRKVPLSVKYFMDSFGV